MGGVWVDYNLMTTIDGLYCIGEANFSDHGANRLGASALMQGLADGYFVLPYTIGDYLSDDIRTGKISTETKEFKDAEVAVRERLEFFINNRGEHSVDYYHKKLGKIMWNNVGMARNEKGLKEAMSEIKSLREDFWKNVKVPGDLNEMNPELEKAGRVADFLELGELFAKDALMREESCGGHFREESVELDGLQKGEAKRNDTDFAFVAAFPNYLSRKYNFIREITESGDKMLIKETKVIDDHYNNCYAGVEVLSMSKRIMNEVMCLAQEKNLKIYYQDTDSMHINDKDIAILEKEFKLKYGRDLKGKYMGQFHSDFELKIDDKKAKNIVATKSIFLGKKSYFDKLEGDIDGNLVNGVHTRMKGINIEGMKHYCKIKNCSMQELYERLYKDDTLWENKNFNPKDKKSSKFDKFDLMAGGTKCKFMYNKDLSVQNCSSFKRGVNFKYEKGIIT